MKRIRDRGGKSGRTAEESIPHSLMREIQRLQGSKHSTRLRAQRAADKLLSTFISAGITTRATYIEETQLGKYVVKHRSTMEHFDIALLIHQIEAPYS